LSVAVRNPTTLRIFVVTETRDHSVALSTAIHATMTSTFAQMTAYTAPYGQTYVRKNVFVGHITGFISSVTSID